MAMTDEVINKTEKEQHAYFPKEENFSQNARPDVRSMEQLRVSGSDYSKMKIDEELRHIKLTDNSNGSKNFNIDLKDVEIVKRKSD